MSSVPLSIYCNPTNRRGFTNMAKAKKKAAKSRPAAGKIEILWLNNDGGGYAERIKVPTNTTVEQLRRKMMPDYDPHDLSIYVNRSVTVAGQKLRTGDSVSITPKNVSGAC